MHVTSVGTGRHKLTCPQGVSFQGTLTTGRNWGSCTEWPQGGSVGLHEVRCSGQPGGRPVQAGSWGRSREGSPFI